MTRWRILFDYDDTLIRHDNDQELKLMAEYLGVELTKTLKCELVTFYTKMGREFNNVKVTKLLFNDFIIANLPFLKHYGIHINKFLEAQMYKDNNHLMIMEDAIQVLEYLKSKNYFMCIFTNGFRDEQIASLKSQGLYEYFDRVYGWDNFYAKPDIRAFYRALAGTSPDENIMIGNSRVNDIAPAKEIGIYTYGFNLDKYGKILPDVELKELKELKTYL